MEKQAEAHQIGVGNAQSKHIGNEKRSPTEKFQAYAAKFQAYAAMERLMHAAGCEGNIGAVAKI